jgi:uracil-DNA glycosylase family 4
VGQRVSNRAPRVSEARAWMPYLMEELEIVAPSTLVCMGGTAAKWLMGKDFALTKERGQWLEGPLGIPSIATFHPAYILRLQGPAKDSALVAFRQDLEKIRQRLEQTGELQRIAA